MCYGLFVQASLQERIAELEQRLDMVILAMGDLGRDGDAQGEEDKTASMGFHTLLVLAITACISSLQRSNIHHKERLELRFSQLHSNLV